MDRRNFIKLTAVTGGAATLASCGNPEHAAHPVHSGRGSDAGHCRNQERRLPAVQRRMRDDRPRHAGRRRCRAQRPGRRRHDEPGQEARRQPDASREPGRALPAWPGGDPDHVSPGPNQGAAQTARRPRQRRLSADQLGRCDWRAGRSAGCACGVGRAGVARVLDAAGRELPATISRRSSSRGSARPRPPRSNCSATTCCGAPIA